jgi:hypothetical protein
MGRIARILYCTAAAALLSSTGCLYSRYATNTTRSATEQLLISSSIRKTLGQLDLPDLRGRAVAVRLSSVPDKDTEYLKGVLEARLGLEGIRIVVPEQAEFTIVALVGAIGSVSRSGAFGLPSIPIPSLGATPEIPFLSVDRQRAWTQAQILTWDRDGNLVDQSQPAIQHSRFDVTTILFLKVHGDDIYPDEDGKRTRE